MNVIVVADTDKAKWGKYLCGKKIISPLEIRKYSDDIIISSAFSKKINGLLKRLYNNKIRIYSV